MVSFSEAPPASALVVAERYHHADTAEEGGGRIDGRGAAAGADAVSKHGDEDEANSGWSPPGLKDLLEVSFDRNFVDSLCKQAGADFFLYGAAPPPPPHKTATTSA